MPRLAEFCFALVVIVGLTRTAAAQDGLPEVMVVQFGVNEYLKDMQYIVELAGAKGKEQWKNSLDPFFGFFTPGLDLNKPLRVDVFWGDETRVRLNVPITQLPAFLNNLPPFGINSKQLAANFYQLALPGGGGAPAANKKNQPPTQAFLRHAFGYAVISYLKTDVPAKLADPGVAIKDLVLKKYDVGCQATNDAQGIDKRRKGFGTFSKNLLDATRKIATETADNFEIRKLLLSQQLEVAERIFVESSRVVAGWTTDVAQHEGRFDIELTALDDTSLDKAIQLLGRNPSHFAHIPRSENAILSGNINFTLDELYQGQLLALTKLLRPNAKRKSDTLEQCDEQKQTAQSVVDMFLDLCEAGTLAGELDGFVEIVPGQNGRHSLVGAIKVPPGDVPRQILKLLPQTDSNLKLELDVDRAGDLAIHKLTGVFNNNADLQDLFGAEAALFCSFEKQTVWYAVALDSPAILKSVMQHARSEDTEQRKTQGAAADDSEKNAKQDQSKKSASDSKKSASDSKKSASDSKKSASDSKKSASDSKKSASDSKKSASDSKKSASDSKKSASDSPKPASDSKKPASDSKKPASDSKQDSVETRKEPENSDDKTQAAAPRSGSAHDASLFDLRVKLGPWIEYLDRRRKRMDQQNSGKTLTSKEQTAQKEDDQLRETAITAFNSGGDSIHVRLQRVGDQVNVRTIFGEGILRFVGSIITNFAAESL